MSKEKEFLNIIKKEISESYNGSYEYWDPEKFNWEVRSYYLTQYCNDYFDIWWDPNKYNWEDDSDYLAQFCSKHFNTWWDPEKFNWEASNWELVKYCSEHFNTWWDSKYVQYLDLKLCELYLTEKQYNLIKLVT